MVIHYANFGNSDDDWDDEPAPVPPPPRASEPATVIGVDLPDFVVIPAHPSADSQGISIELSAAVTGEPVAIVFSNVDRLTERLGVHQPWVMVRSEFLPRLLGTTSISVVLDPLEKTCRVQWTSKRLDDMVLFQQGMERAEPIRGDIRA